MHIGLGDIILTGAPTYTPLPFTPGTNASTEPTVAPSPYTFQPFTPADLAQVNAYYTATVPPAYPGGPWRTPAQKAADDATLAAAVTGKVQGATGSTVADKPAAGTAAGSQQMLTQTPGFLSQYGLPLAIAGGIGALFLMKGK